MIVGHEKQWKFLRAAYEEQSFSHAYLFSGEEQIGKKSTALEFVKFLHCSQKNGRACGECSSCKAVEKGVHPDFLLIERGEGNEIKVEQVERLLRHLSLKPSVSKYKTVIIDEAHLLNRYGQNSLLKTLEEPGGESILFLISSKPYLLFETVLSRVQKINFYPLSRGEMEKFLQERNVKEETKKEILELTQGRPGRAVELIENPSLVKKEKERKKQLEKVLSLDLGSRFETAKSLSKEDLEPVFTSWMRFFRGEILNKLDKNGDTKKEEQALDAIQRSFYLLKTSNVNKKILLQNLMLKL